jgi:mannosyltransferase OCH1-like enzyme
MVPRHIITTWICSPDRDKYRNEDRELFLRCLKSWLKLMPDYKLTIVTLGSLFDYGSEEWIKREVNKGNYIAASQWARLYWLKVHGGIYLDMDVEVTKRFDNLLNKSFTIAHMKTPETWANNAVMISEPNHPFLIEQLKFLETVDTSIKEYGNESGPIMISKLLQGKGWNGVNEDIQLNGVTILDSKSFYPYSFTENFNRNCITEKTYAIHHWGQSWFDQAGLQRWKIQRF